ncbi:MAG: hypothetical protein RQ899_14030 [Pseudomonadales bacterium]|nr:hypothetical protein [Pseudomonadales bacterium]
MTALLLVLPACAPLVEIGDGRLVLTNSAAFRAYAEEVFRRHNMAAVAIIDALDAVGDESPDAAALEQADEEMLQACETLNLLAIARRDGKKVSRRQLRAIVPAVPRCSSATAHAESLIEKVGPEFI